MTYHTLFTLWVMTQIIGLAATVLLVTLLIIFWLYSTKVPDYKGKKILQILYGKKRRGHGRKKR